MMLPFRQGRSLEGKAMKIKQIGHAVLKVSDCERAEKFYGGILGLPVCARLDQDGMKMTFFTLGNHHDFAVMEVSGEGSTHAETAAGLHHVAFKIGDSLDELREAKALLEAAGVTPSPGRPRGDQVALFRRSGRQRHRALRRRLRHLAPRTPARRPTPSAGALA